MNLDWFSKKTILELVTLGVLNSITFKMNNRT